MLCIIFAGKVYNLTVLMTNTSFDDFLWFAHSPQFIELRREFELGVSIKLILPVLKTLFVISFCKQKENSNRTLRNIPSEVEKKCFITQLNLGVKLKSFKIANVYASKGIAQYQQNKFTYVLSISPFFLLIEACNFNFGRNNTLVIKLVVQIRIIKIES